MVDRQFLDPDRPRERTTFADGTTVAVDWPAQPVDVERPLTQAELRGTEYLPTAKSKPDMSLIYPVDPKQLPRELSGVKWPLKPESRISLFNSSQVP